MSKFDHEIALRARETLLLLSNCIGQLTLDEYIEKINLLSQSSIGEHTRHIVEMFQQLLAGYDDGVVNYEKRKRNKKIEENIDEALESIATIITNLEKENKPISISTCKEESTPLISNYQRELSYNIDHCIHHQAMIKIALLFLKKENIDKEFGVAKATIESRC